MPRSGILPFKADGNRLSRPRVLGRYHASNPFLQASFAGKGEVLDLFVGLPERRCYDQARPALLVSGVGTCGGHL